MRSPDLYLGDCLFWLAMLPDNSVDSIVTDPPYGLSFMGKKWDYDVPGEAIWRECLRVLKPGGHLLAFAGTRTQHRMAVRIEDAGFEIRDMIAWVYGSGFPKSLDVSKAIDSNAGQDRPDAIKGGHMGISIRGGDPRSQRADFLQKTVPSEVNKGAAMRGTPVTDAARQWQGWGTALKPALEPITVARKPLVGTVAENVLAHGTGALNVDGCRVYADDAQGGTYTVKRFAPGASVNKDGNWKQDVEFTGEMKAGRWPANLIHDGSDEVVAGFPETGVSKGTAQFKTHTTYQWSKSHPDATAEPQYGAEIGYGDTGSAARFFYCAKASKRDRDEGLEGFAETLVAGSNQAKAELKRGNTDFAGDAENVTGWHKVKAVRNHHPTVKPTDLMRYLCRLVTPPGGTVLDPFMGSGSTGKAAALEGFHFIGMERDADYFTIAQARIDHARKED